ncbi:binding partner of ACD11 1-like isoform X2 [Phalaenopsis equestris]|nr:binding partner of ACD11 1-like isoform X2 [Phalaenopsis equestris]
MQSESDGSWIAYVTFYDKQGADTAVLLSGATIADRAVTVTYADNYELPPEAYRPAPVALEDSAVKRAEDIVTTIIAKSFILGKDALNTAKSFDEQHHITSNATATVASIDRRLGLSEKISMGTTMMSEKMHEVDKRYQVSEITKSALAAAEQKASTASSAVMANHYVSTGASWLSNAYNRVSKAAEDVTLMTREKVGKVEDEKNEIIYRERKEMLSDFVEFHLDDSYGEPATVPVASADEYKKGR